MFVEEKKQGEVELDAANQLLLKAASVLEKRGLWKHWFAEPGGIRLCMIGALRVAQHGKPEVANYGVGDIARRRLRAKLGPDDAPAQWNDEPERTKEEVVAMLRAVALSGQC